MSSVESHNDQLPDRALYFSLRFFKPPTVYVLFPCGVKLTFLCRSLLLRFVLYFYPPSYVFLFLLQRRSSVGTPAFTAPELCLSENAPVGPTKSFKADIWSLGASLFYLVRTTLSSLAKYRFDRSSLLVPHSYSQHLSPLLSCRCRCMDVRRSWQEPSLKCTTVSVQSSWIFRQLPKSRRSSRNA